MADVAAVEMPVNAAKKPKNSRKALKQKNPSTNEANILAQELSTGPSPVPVPPSAEANPNKENTQGLSSPKKGKSKAKSKAKQQQQENEQPQQHQQQQQDFERELQAMQEMMEKLKIEKEKTEELLKQKDEILKRKDEELKKLHKLKEFRPTVSFPIVQTMKDKEQDKKEKKKTCPEIKRPSTPYILWCKDQWNEVKKENPEAEFKEISNILGAKWKNISVEEKKPYEEKYQAEKEAYLQLMAKEQREAEAMKLLEEEHKKKTALELLDQYLQFKQEAEKDNKKTKKERDPMKPKQPMSAFFLFTNERRAALLEANKNVLEISKILGEEWKNMSEVQKKPYEKMAKKNKEKYLQEMEAYKQKKDEEADNLRKEEEEQMKLQKQEALQLLKKKEKTDIIIKKTKENRQKKKKQKEEKKKNEDPNKPKKPASSFLLFSKETRKNLLEERPGINNSTLTALISVKWKELSEEERQVWNSKAAEAMEAYKKELEDYNKSVAAVAGNIQLE